MRLDAIEQREWQKVAAYVDTLILPVSSFRLVDKSIDVAGREEIQAIASMLEKRLTGRALLLPDISYTGQNKELFSTYILEVINQFLQSGFYHLLVVADAAVEVEWQRTEGSWLQVLHAKVEVGKTSPEATADELYAQVLEIWQRST